MERWVGKVAVVTGASAGIGASICEVLVDKAIIVVGLARRVERVEEVARKLSGKPGKLHAVKCDVSNKDEVTSAFQWIQNNLGPVAILVNNAGIVRPGTFSEGQYEDWKSIIDTNVLALAQCSQEAIKQMRDAGIAGHIIHINSVAGHSKISGTPPMMNIYSPSKNAVTCMTEIMRREMVHLGTKIKITSISPGVVKTEIMVAAKTDFKLDLYDTMPHLLPEDVADAVVYALGTNPNTNISEITLQSVEETPFI